MLRIVCLTLLLILAGPVPAQTPPSILIVNGHGSAGAEPDQARLALGAVAQAEEAAAAQAAVNRVMNEALKAVRELGIAQTNLTTAGISVSPVYRDWSDSREQREPRIVGYRANNRLLIRLDDVRLVGRVIDAAIAAGANQVDSLQLGLSDDALVRAEALRLAVQDARARADAISQALRMRIAGVEEVREEGVGIIGPPPGVIRAMAQSEADTPVAGGEIRVEASVQVRYRIEPLSAVPAP